VSTDRRKEIASLYGSKNATKGRENLGPRNLHIRRVNIDKEEGGSNRWNILVQKPKEQMERKIPSKT